MYLPYLNIDLFVNKAFLQNFALVIFTNVFFVYLTLFFLILMNGDNNEKYKYMERHSKRKRIPRVK